MVEKNVPKETGPIIKTIKHSNSYFLETLQRRILKDIHQKKRDDKKIVNLSAFHNEGTQIMNNKDAILAYLRTNGISGTLGRYEDGTIYYNFL